MLYRELNVPQHHTLRHRKLKSGEVIHTTANTGIILVESNESMQTAIARADQAMYQGKQQGRNQVVFA
ncbi:diguanylate cyclase [Acinetobacter sp. ANC 7454]|uniref:GGDEF domain-containing protein n=1 Tax=Acinetobacter thermotolerans TaxID=3151487 RepID=UPI00325C035B